MNTANCRSAHHLHRRRQGRPALSRLPDRAARRRERLPRNGVPDSVRRAADRGAAAGVDARDHAPHDAAREHQEVDGGLPVRRAPDGRSSSARSARCRRFYPDAKNIFDKAVAAAADAPADRQGAEHRRLRVPPQHRPPLHLSRQRPELHRQLPEHAVQDDRAEVPAEPGARRARSTCSSSCTPITSRTAARRRCGRSAARTSIRTRRWPARRRRSTVRCTAARTKPCCGC